MGGLYGNIFDCNLVIQMVEGSEIHKKNKEKVDVLLGQTYGIRALYYFTLYRAYGGVPLVRRVKVLDGQVSQPIYIPGAPLQNGYGFHKIGYTKIT